MLTHETKGCKIHMNKKEQMYGRWLRAEDLEKNIPSWTDGDAVESDYMVVSLPENTEQPPGDGGAVEKDETVRSPFSSSIVAPILKNMEIIDSLNGKVMNVSLHKDRHKIISEGRPGLHDFAVHSVHMDIEQPLRRESIISNNRNNNGLEIGKGRVSGMDSMGLGQVKRLINFSEVAQNKKKKTKVNQKLGFRPGELTVDGDLWEVSISTIPQPRREQ